MHRLTTALVLFLVAAGGIAQCQEAPPNQSIGGSVTTEESPPSVAQAPLSEQRPPAPTDSGSDLSASGGLQEQAETQSRPSEEGVDEEEGTWEWITQFFAAFAPYATSVAILLTSGWTAYILKRYYDKQDELQRKQFEQGRLERSHTLLLKAMDLQSSFWASDILSNVRKEISIDEEYGKITETLRNRNSSIACRVTGTEYDTLERIDRLYSAIASLQTLRNAADEILSGDPSHERLLASRVGDADHVPTPGVNLATNETNGSSPESVAEIEAIAKSTKTMIEGTYKHWVDLLATKERNDLRKYVQNHWKGVALPPMLNAKEEANRIAINEVT